MCSYTYFGVMHIMGGSILFSQNRICEFLVSSNSLGGLSWGCSISMSEFSAKNWRGLISQNRESRIFGMFSVHILDNVRRLGIRLRAMVPRWRNSKITPKTWKTYAFYKLNNPICLRYSFTPLKFHKFHNKSLDFFVSQKQK